MTSAESPAPALTAVVLAAGLGARLRAVHDGRPKGFVAVGGTPIIVRSLTQLAAAGVRDIVLVAGWRAEVYRELLAAQFPAVRLVLNPDYATTGSLASLRLGVGAADGDVLVVESDLLYEDRALTTLLAAPARDTLLASGPTASGDEVWVYGRDGRLAHLSKRDWPHAPRLGELVGLTRLSRPLVERLAAAAPGLLPESHYEDGLNAVCAAHPVTVLAVDDLAWCEIDDPAHLHRARTEVWPRIVAAERASLSAPATR